MADFDSFANGASDGDTVSDGWINGCYDYVIDLETYQNEINVINIETRGVFGTGGNNYPKVSFISTYVDWFNSDSLETSTGLTYNTYTDEYYKDDNNVYTAETHDLPSTSTISDGVVFVDYEVFETIDECDNSSVDSSVWTTTSGTVTETTSLNITGQGGTSYARSKDLSSEKVILVKAFVQAHALSDGSAQTSSIILTDGTSSTGLVAAISSYTGDTPFYHAEVKVIVTDWANKKVMVEVAYYGENDRTESGTYKYLFFDRYNKLYTLTGYTALQVEVKATNGGASADCRVYSLRASKNGPDTATPTISLSADGGANWETVTNGKEHAFTNTGTLLKARISGTPAVGEVVVLNGFKMGITGVV